VISDRGVFEVAPMAGRHCESGYRDIGLLSSRFGSFGNLVRKYQGRITYPAGDSLDRRCMRGHIP
jgi:hypothetical protein